MFVVNNQNQKQYKNFNRKKSVTSELNWYELRSLIVVVGTEQNQTKELMHRNGWGESPQNVKSISLQKELIISAKRDRIFTKWEIFVNYLQ